MNPFGKGELNIDGRQHRGHRRPNPGASIGVGRHEDHFEEGSKAVNMLTRALGCVLFSAQTQSPAVTTSIGG
jgi:hypothetical protein